MRKSSSYYESLVALNKRLAGDKKLPVTIKEAPQTLQDEDLLKPAAIADTFWFLAHQDPSAWSHEIDVRPFKERF